MTEEIDDHKKSRGQENITMGVIHGEGIGKEIIDVAIQALNTLAKKNAKTVAILYAGPIGHDALKLNKKSLPPEVEEFCTSIFNEGGAILCGPGGARFVYDLRKRFNLFYKLTPICPTKSLADSSIIRQELLTDTDMLMVRENMGGLYFGENHEHIDKENKRKATITFGYHEDEINRILDIAFKAALLRKNKVTVILKQEAIPSISMLWILCTEALAKRYPSVQVEILDIDNAAYQIIANPSRFDVIVSSNMFGDILADTGSLLLGSRGMSYSANFSEEGFAVYQTGHGAAYDIKDKNIANPIGQLLSLSMMLENHYHWTSESIMLRKAIENILSQGIRTKDIASQNSQIVGTKEFGNYIVREIEKQ